jgi:polysaccharide pyruvyl transferase WcaK-like protein
LAITDFVKKHNLERFPIQIIKYNNDPHEYCKLLAQSKLLISIRLHGAILGYALKTPFFMISYHEKCIDFFNELSLDKRYLVDVDKHAELYVDEIGKILNNESNFEFDDQYGHHSLDHFKING